MKIIFYWLFLIAYFAITVTMVLQLIFFELEILIKILTILSIIFLLSIQTSIIVALFKHKK